MVAVGWNSIRLPQMWLDGNDGRCIGFSAHSDVGVEEPGLVRVQRVLDDE